MAGKRISDKERLDWLLDFGATCNTKERWERFLDQYYAELTLGPRACLDAAIRRERGER